MLRQVEIVRKEVRPNSKAQERFFESNEYEVLYGGSAGSGKSWCLVVEPLRYIGHEKFTGIIFRNSYPELERSIMPLCNEYYPHAGGVYHVQNKRWTFPSGATIDLGYMEKEGDWEIYKGSEYAYQGWDELTTFKKLQWDMLRAWNRSKVEGLPAYRRATSNPGGIGHAWVKKEFVDMCPPLPDGPKKQDEVTGLMWQPVKPSPTYFWTWEDEVTHFRMTSTRRFIPARVFDNQPMLKRNPQYVAALLQMPMHKRKALLEGDWEIFEGMFFGAFNERTHMVPPIWTPPKGWVLAGGLDYGNTTVLEVAAVVGGNELRVGDKEYMRGDIVNFAECCTFAETSEQRAHEIADVIEERGLWNLRIYHDSFLKTNPKDYQAKRSPLQTMQEIFRERLGSRAPILRMSSRKGAENKSYRVTCNEVFKNLINFELGEDAEMVKRPKWYVTEECPQLIKCIPELIHDPDSLRGLDFEHDERTEDHCFDSAKMNFLPLKEKIKTEDIDRPLEWWEEVGMASMHPQTQMETWRDPFKI